ncbi:hypothetical protein FSARC_3423 [Fusarium sarcochroum]|uniref:Uncharacterized protein n=1 Tax=Fusarium sarcochroum TaxID=1208366 RepID=A0A8H4XBT3_9HYPO|nr:hypothetical protein FSARC_3423 [Fusarium sarcochroum]
MHFSLPLSIALAALTNTAFGMEKDGWISLTEAEKNGQGPGDNDKWLWLKKDGSSVLERASKDDKYFDATGRLPDGTKYSQATSHSETVTTTTSFNMGGGATIDFGSLSSSMGISTSLAVTTTETETIEITIKCNGKRGIVQYQPLFTRFDGKLCKGIFCFAKDEGENGAAFLPELSGSGGQLANFRVQCEDGSIADGSRRLARRAVKHNA